MTCHYMQDVAAVQQTCARPAAADVRTASCSRRAHGQLHAHGQLQQTCARPAALEALQGTVQSVYAKHLATPRAGRARRVVHLARVGCCLGLGERDVLCTSLASSQGREADWKSDQRGDGGESSDVHRGEAELRRRGQHGACLHNWSSAVTGAVHWSSAMEQCTGAVHWSSAVTGALQQGDNKMHRLHLLAELTITARGSCGGEMDRASKRSYTAVCHTESPAAISRHR